MANKDNANGLSPRNPQTRNTYLVLSVGLQAIEILGVVAGSLLSPWAYVVAGVAAAVDGLYLNPIWYAFSQDSKERSQAFFGVSKLGIAGGLLLGLAVSNVYIIALAGLLMALCIGLAWVEGKQSGVFWSGLDKSTPGVGADVAARRMGSSPLSPLFGSPFSSEEQQSRQTTAGGMMGEVFTFEEPENSISREGSRSCSYIEVEDGQLLDPSPELTLGGTTISI